MFIEIIPSLKGELGTHMTIQAHEVFKNSSTLTEFITNLAEVTKNNSTICLNELSSYQASVAYLYITRHCNFTNIKFDWNVTNFGWQLNLDNEKYQISKDGFCSFTTESLDKAFLAVALQEYAFHSINEFPPKEEYRPLMVMAKEWRLSPSTVRGAIYNQKLSDKYYIYSEDKNLILVHPIGMKKTFGEKREDLP